ALIDADGTLVARARISDDIAGLQQLLGLLAEHGDTRIPVAIETSRGLLVACLRATGRPTYAINPLAASRYRERRTVVRKKSDHLDAMVLANILRTDAAAHRSLPADSELAQAVAELARAQQDAVWDRTQAGNKLRSHPREYFPGYLAAVQPVLGGLCSPLARALLAAAPTPARAASLTSAQLRAVLKRAGRQRGIEAEATRLRAALRSPQMRQLPLVEGAMGRQTLTLLLKLDAACTSADELAEAAVETFERHPDSEIVTSFPGLGSLTGARILAEVGDDPSRFADARALKSYAGAAPVTRASGKSIPQKDATRPRLTNGLLRRVGSRGIGNALQKQLIGALSTGGFCSISSRLVCLYEGAPSCIVIWIAVKYALGERERRGIGTRFDLDFCQL
ncbi:transposase, partial [Streptomyces chartreusis]